jgi:hypothetical protein
MFSLRSLLPLAAIAPLALGGCNEIRKFTGVSRDQDDRYAYQSGSYYTQPAYGQPGYQQPAYPQPTYAQPANNSSEFQFNNSQAQVYGQSNLQAGQFPTTGHWEWGTSPDGRRTRIWIPDNSYKLPPEAYGVNVPQPWAPPRYDAMYSNARGRYDTIRLPDGRLEHEWRGNEPSSPAQGYWQIVNNGPGSQRLWVPSAENTASER